MPVLKNIGLLARCLPAGAQDQIHPIQQAALAWDGGIIRWVGPEADLPLPGEDPFEEPGGACAVDRDTLRGPLRKAMPGARSS